MTTETDTELIHRLQAENAGLRQKHEAALALLRELVGPDRCHCEPPCAYERARALLGTAAPLPETPTECKHPRNVCFEFGAENFRAVWCSTCGALADAANGGIYFGLPWGDRPQQWARPGVYRAREDHRFPPPVQPSTPEPSEDDGIGCIKPNDCDQSMHCAAANRCLARGTKGTTEPSGEAKPETDAEFEARLRRMEAEGADPYDILGEVVERHPIPSARHGGASIAEPSGERCGGTRQVTRPREGMVAWSSDWMEVPCPGCPDCVGSPPSEPTR